MSLTLSIDSCDPLHTVCTVVARVARKQEQVLGRAAGPGRQGARSRILFLAQTALRRAKKNLRACDSIRVVPGPGPFTAVRTGVVVANALAWALGIPIYAYGQKERGGKFRPVMPEYGGEPNITIGKGSVTRDQ